MFPVNIIHAKAAQFGLNYLVVTDGRRCLDFHGGNAEKQGRAEIQFLFGVAFAPLSRAVFAGREHRSF